MNKFTYKNKAGRALTVPGIGTVKPDAVFTSPVELFNVNLVPQGHKKSMSEYKTESKSKRSKY